MTRYETYADIAFLLYLVPFIVSGAYAMVLWTQTGLSETIPQSAYLEVTENPDVFLIGLFAVLLAAMLEVAGRDAGGRRAELFSLSKRLQSVALVSFVLSLLMAWYTAGFSGNLSAFVLTFLAGRYAAVFPALLVLFSFMILPTFTLQRRHVRSLAGVISLVAVPAAMYEIGRRNIGAGYLVAVILLALGIFLIAMRRPSKTEPA